MIIYKNKIIYYRESLLQSFLSDFLSFGFLALTFWVNYRFIGGNNLVDVILLLLFCLFFIAKSNRTNEFSSYEELLKFIKKEIKLNALKKSKTKTK